MKKLIYKYRLDLLPGRQAISMPKGAKVLHFALRYGAPTIWAEVDDKAPQETRNFCVLETGESEVAGFREYHYIGTALTQDDVFVWHLYEVL